MHIVGGETRGWYEEMEKAYVYTYVPHMVYIERGQRDRDRKIKVSEIYR